MLPPNSRTPTVTRYSAYASCYLYRSAHAESASKNAQNIRRACSLSQPHARRYHPTPRQILLRSKALLCPPPLKGRGYERGFCPRARRRACEAAKHGKGAGKPCKGVPANNKKGLFAASAEGVSGETNDAHSRVQKVPFVSVVLQRLAPLPDNLSEITRVPPIKQF